MSYRLSPPPFLLDLNCRLAIYFQVYPKDTLEAVKKEKGFLEREFFNPSAERKWP